jgi:pimeloyl-ACP methyl ester carboxylesterase
MDVETGGVQIAPARFAHAEWPYEPKFKRVNGWRMHYIDEGAGDPVVLLHGNPAWGFLYRKFVRPLTAAGRRVPLFTHRLLGQA